MTAPARQSRRRGRRHLVPPPAPRPAARNAAPPPPAAAALLALFREQVGVIREAAGNANAVLAAHGHAVTWAEKLNGFAGACRGCPHRFAIVLDGRGQFQLVTVTGVRHGGGGLPDCRDVAR